MNLRELLNYNNLRSRVSFECGREYKWPIFNFICMCCFDSEMSYEFKHRGDIFILLPFTLVIVCLLYIVVY